MCYCIDGYGRNADVTESADVQDLGSCAERRMGSSPFIRTKYFPCNINDYRDFIIYKVPTEVPTTYFYPLESNIT